MSRLSKLIRSWSKKSRHQTKSALLNERFEIGDHSYGVPIVRSWGEASRLAIGRYCSIADNVQIFLGGNHRTNWVSTYPFSKAVGWRDDPIVEAAATKGDVVIGNDVWIGSGAAILSGVTLGDGCVVGAFAVVAKDVPPYAVVVGNPAKTVKSRFDEETIKSLMDIRWWDWDEERVRRFVPYLLSNDIEAFLKAAK